jgi:ATP-dependent RNA helicase DDX42
VRGVDFGLGIGYNPEGTSTAAPSQSSTSRSPVVSSLKTGMMQQFRSSFVSASSNSQVNHAGMVPVARPALRGFVSGGTIGGDTYKAQPVVTNVPSSGTVNPSSQHGNRSNDRLVCHF